MEGGGREREKWKEEGERGRNGRRREREGGMRGGGREREEWKV
jgi:hypothetical protein